MNCEALKQNFAPSQLALAALKAAAGQTGLLCKSAAEICKMRTQQIAAAHSSSAHLSSTPT